MSIAQTTGGAVRFVLDNYPRANKAKLARALGVTYMTVYNWEQGKTKMTYPVYLIFRKLYPHLEISDVVNSPEYSLGQVDLTKRAFTTREAIPYILLHDTDANQARLAQALGCTQVTVSNYAVGRSRMSQTVYAAFRKLYPTIEVTDVYRARA